MLPMATEEAFGQKTRGRPVGHDSYIISNNRGSKRNNERNYSGQTAGSVETPTGRHNRRMVFARTGMINTLSNINNTKINDYFFAKSNNNGDSVGIYPGFSTGSGSLAEQGLNNQRGNKGDATRNGDTVILNILGHLAPKVNAEEGGQCLEKGENTVDSVVRRLQGHNNEGNKDKHCQGKKKRRKKGGSRLGKHTSPVASPQQQVRGNMTPRVPKPRQYIGPIIERGVGFPVRAYDVKKIRAKLMRIRGTRSPGNHKRDVGMIKAVQPNGQLMSREDMLKRSREDLAQGTVCLNTGRSKRQATLDIWMGGRSEGMTNLNKDATRKQKLDKHALTVEEIKEKRKRRVLEANKKTEPSFTPSQKMGQDADNILSFEHINVNGIRPHDEFIELKNTMGILHNMEASVYSLVETQWDTTCPVLARNIKDIIKKEDTYAKVEFASNQDEHFEKSWKPGGTMIGVSGKWACRAESTGSDHMGRWSWVDLRGKKGRMIRVISAYRVSQEQIAQAGETTSCKQQVRSLLKRGIKIQTQRLPSSRTWDNSSIIGEQRVQLMR